MAAPKLKAVPQMRGYAKRYQRFDAPAPYEGYFIEVWANYPQKAIRAVGRAAQSGDQDALIEAFRGQPLIREWNLTDFEGNPLTLPSDDPESLMELPGDLVAWVFTSIAEAPEKALEDDGLPNT